MRSPALPLVLGICILASCSPLRPSTSGRDLPGVLVSAEKIRASGAGNAWEAIRRTLPHLRLTHDRHNRAVGISHRGTASVYLKDHPNIIVDGIRIMDLERLQQIPATDIHTIRFLGGIDGTTRFGTNSGDGVIVIRTRGSADIS